MFDALLTHTAGQGRVGVRRTLPFAPPSVRDALLCACTPEQGSQARALISLRAVLHEQTGLFGTHISRCCGALNMPSLVLGLYIFDFDNFHTAVQ